MKKLKYQILFTILFMTIGIAAVTTNLVTNGNTKITSNPDDFLVYFSDVKMDGITDLSLVDSETHLVFNKELSIIGQSFVISYDVTNASKNYDAAVDITCTQSTDYITISNSFDTTNNLSARSTKTGTLSITLTKSYVGTGITQDISCTINASAVERNSQSNATIPDFVTPLSSTLKATNYSDKTMFRSAEYKNSIRTITFEDSINIPAEAVETWDISVEGNNRIIAYLTKNEYDSNFYDLYIQSNGKIYGNSDMSYWFDGMQYVDSINGLELLDTSEVTTMYSMFSGTGSKSEIFALDVSSFDTSQVTDMRYMFAGTGELSKTFTLDVSGFNTSKVTKMNGMFGATGANSEIFYLDISSFDTSNVLEMECMFESVAYKSENFNLNLGYFDTSSVIDISFAFNYAGSNSSKLNFTITIRNPNMLYYNEIFWESATKPGTQITVNYTKDTEAIVDEIILYKYEKSNVVKGIQVD